MNEDSSEARGDHILRFVLAGMVVFGVAVSWVSGWIIPELMPRSDYHMDIPGVSVFLVAFEFLALALLTRRIHRETGIGSGPRARRVAGIALAFVEGGVFALWVSAPYHGNLDAQMGIGIFLNSGLPLIGMGLGYVSGWSLAGLWQLAFRRGQQPLPAQLRIGLALLSLNLWIVGSTVHEEAEHFIAESWTSSPERLRALLGGEKNPEKWILLAHRLVFNPACPPDVLSEINRIVNEGGKQEPQGPISQQSAKWWPIIKSLFRGPTFPHNLLSPRGRENATGKPEAASSASGNLVVMEFRGYGEDLVTWNRTAQALKIGIAKHRNARPSLLRQLAADTDTYERRLLLSNPNTPEDVAAAIHEELIARAHSKEIRNEVDLLMRGRKSKPR